MTTKTTSARIVCLISALALSASFALAQQAGNPQDQGPDPALANLAPADAAAQAQQAGQPAGPAYGEQAPAPIVRSAPSSTDPSYNYNAPAAAADVPAPTDPGTYSDGGTAPGADANVAAGEAALADAGVAADQPPPPLPDYEQPAAPAEDNIWTPGYWAYGPYGYYWVPGAWVVPPYYGALWTPPYWGFYGGRYRWHPGYWGLHIGFYGGIDYGFGYIGTGYFGGYWAGNVFFYNRAVTNVGFGVTTFYSRPVIFNNHVYGAHPSVFVSYNGGRGGIQVAPRPAELMAMHYERHVAALPAQRALRSSFASNPQAAFSNNHGHPAVAVQSRPLGAGRPAAPPAAFQPRGNTPTAPAYNRPASQPAYQGRPQAQPQSQPQYQPQSQPRSQPAPQYQPNQARPQPQARPAPKPAAHPAPPKDDKK